MKLKQIIELDESKELTLRTEKEFFIGEINMPTILLITILLAFILISKYLGF